MGQPTSEPPESIVSPDADYSLQPGDPEYDTVVRERKAFINGFRVGVTARGSTHSDEEVLQIGFDRGLI